jgi:hypothetical protein
MYRNHYADEIERWKVNLVVSRARRMGFRDHDLDDVQQQIVPQVKAFVFDADRSNDATEATVLVALIDRQLLLIRRKAIRYQKHLDRIRAMRSIEGESSQAACQSCHREDNTLLLLDVRESVAKLPSREQLICHALTDELIAETRRVWSPHYGRVISEDEAIEILHNVKRFVELLWSIKRETVQQ